MTETASGRGRRDRAAIEMLGGLLEREAHLVAHYPYALPSHLHNRLLADAAPQELLDGARRALETRPWARLTNRVAGLPGQAAARVLDHGGRVICVRWSRRGDRLVTAAEDGHVRLWDAATGRCLQELRSESGRLTDLDVSPGGESLATAGTDGVWVCDLERADTKHFPARGERVAWAPDGSTIASAVGAAIDIWDPRNGELMARLEGERTVIGALAWSPDGSRLASGTDAGSLRIWTPQRGAAAEGVLELGGLSYLRPLARAISGLAWAPHGTTLAVATRAGTVSFCEPDPWREIVVLQVGDSWLGALAWAPSGRHLAVAHDNVIDVLDADRGRVVGSVAGQSEWTRLAAHGPFATPAAEAPVVASFTGHTGTINALAWAADGETLASASFDGSARLWSPSSFRPPASSGRDRSVAAAGVRRETGSFRELLTRHGERLSGYFGKPGAGARHLIALSPEGLRLATAAGVRDLRNELPIAELPAGKPLTALAWSADGTRLALGREDGEIRVCGVGSDGPGSVIREGWKESASPRSSPGFIDFGQYAGIGGHHIRLFDPDYIPVEALAWSPDQRRLAAAGRTLGFELRDLETGEVGRFDTGPANLTLSHLAWSPDGLLIASAEGEMSQLAEQPFLIRIWDLDGGADRIVFEGDAGWSALAWAPDGSLLAFASAGGAVRVWSASLDKTLLVAHGHSPVRMLRFEAEDGSVGAGSGPRYLCAVDDGAGTGGRPIPYVWELCNFEAERLGAEADRIEAVFGRRATRATAIRRGTSPPDSLKAAAPQAAAEAGRPSAPPPPRLDVPGGLPAPPRTWLDVPGAHEPSATPPWAAPAAAPRAGGFTTEIEELWDRAAGLLERAQHELKSGSPQAALRLLEESEPLWRRLDDRESLARCLGARAAALLQSDRVDLALGPLSESVAILRELAVPAALAAGLTLHAELLLAAGNDEDAGNCAAEAAEIFASLDRAVDEARARALLMRARIGRPTILKGILVVLLMLAPAGIGIALGLWSPWLWLLGVPLMLLSVFLLATAVSPGLRQIIERAAAKM